MKLRLAPLNVPLERRLQTAAALQWVFSFLVLAQVCLAAFMLLLLSDWWMLAVLYAGWLWLDGDTPTSGGRRSDWMRSWRVWEFFRDYFPLRLLKTVDLDPKKNYIFGFHPHGLVSSSKSSPSHLSPPHSPVSLSHLSHLSHLTHLSLSLTCLTCRPGLQQ
ncbi:hypothetical protein KUCAC02_034788 [Chaenocephalus aceratus]|nr:hypothetical protein KUCAC02_034788 [Chaenocephalus aceratus]